MAGIMDMLTNIRTEGTGVPMADPNMIAQMAPPPQGPMMDPGMSDPAAEIMAMIQNDQASQEDSMSIEGDAAMLAETVFERAQGDPNTAMAILDTAKSMIAGAGQEQDPQMMMGGGQEPQMMMGGGYMKPKKYANGGYMNKEDALSKLY
jgi:hypothetical protein